MRDDINECLYLSKTEIDDLIYHLWFVATPGTPQLIIFSVVCKSDIKKVHGNSTDLLFEKIVLGQKHPMKAYIHLTS